jgi:hypothetical protein
MNIDWPDVEQTLRRIPDVTGARVVHDHDAVRELHIVARPGKHPKQLVRDVLSVAAASFGVEVDRNVVSVVQLDEAGGDDQVPAVSAGQRTLLSGMTLHSEQGLVTVTVSLHWRGRQATCSSERALSALGTQRLAAEATLGAVRQLHPELPAVDVESMEVRQVGAGRVAIVGLSQRTSRGDDRLFGTASVRGAGEPDAVARAVLDALNRLLPG